MSHLLDMEADMSGDESAGSDASKWSAHSSDADANASTPEDADDVMSHRQMMRSLMMRITRKHPSRKTSSLRRERYPAE